MIRGVRGKYARAFQDGVEVVVRDALGRESRRLLRRLPDGSLQWKALPDQNRAIDDAA